MEIPETIVSRPLSLWRIYRSTNTSSLSNVTEIAGPHHFQGGEMVHLQDEVALAVRIWREWPGKVESEGVKEAGGACE